MSFKREISGFNRLINLLTFKKHQPVSQTGLKLNDKNYLSIKDHIIVDITSWIINTDVFQLCQSRSDMASQIDPYTMDIHRGLMKLYLMQFADKKERDRWKEEISDMILNIGSEYQDSPYFSRENKKFTASEYYDLLYWRSFHRNNMNSLKNYVEIRFSGNYIYDIEYDTNECYMLFDRFFANVSNMLNSSIFEQEDIHDLLNMFDIKNI